MKLATIITHNDEGDGDYNGDTVDKDTKIQIVYVGSLVTMLVLHG